MQVKFVKDEVLSYDGINTKEYKAGEVYEATHAQERIVFEKAIYMGKAVTFASEAEPQVETKVAKPKARK
jgi:hypothetical protein